MSFNSIRIHVTLPPAQVMDSKSTVSPHLHLVYAENSTLPGFEMQIYEICSATRGFSSQPRVVTVCIRPENLIPEHYHKKVEHLQSFRGVSSGKSLFNLLQPNLNVILLFEGQAMF